MMKRLWKVATAVVCVMPFIAIARQKSNANHDAYVQSLLQERREFAPPSFDPARTDARNQRARQLYAIWLARDQRSVAGEVAPFLQDEDRYVRNSAARILGRLKEPAALAELQQLSDATKRKLAKDPEYAAKAVEPLPLELSLARAQAQQLRGRAKAEAFARGMGLSFEDVVKLSQQVNTKRSSLTMGTTADVIVREMVDVLYEMGKQGDDVQPLANRLTLNKAQQVRLQAAGLPVEQEVKLILDHTAQLKVVTGDEGELCERHLASLGPVAAEMIIERLTEMQEHPERFPDTGYATRHATVFTAAALTGDRRTIPLLKHFEQSPNMWMRHYAFSARSALEKQAWPPPLPLP